MKMTTIQIDLVTEIGTFKFAEHFDSTANPYQAMCCFESNNWEKLGETSYIVYQTDEDEKVWLTNFNGMNASANLSAFVEGTDLDIPNID